MKVLAVTCYTGDKELAAMTGRCLKGLSECVPEGVKLETSVVGQGTSFAPPAPIDKLTFYPHNVGFAFGMNLAIRNANLVDPDFVLCFNNDLEFPHKDWLRILLEIAAGRRDQIFVPATDSAAIRTQPGPLNKGTYPIDESSAYCWLVPFAWCKWLKETHGFWLFDEEFEPAYGEDNWTAFLLSKQFGSGCFRYVPRSFVKHLRARTSRTIKHDRAKSSRTLVAKLQAELEDPQLRQDLRVWARRYVKLLSKKA